MADTNPFHEHLDVCKQCREHPFGLCPVGVGLANDEITGCADDQIWAGYSAEQLRQAVQKKLPR